MPCTCPEIIVWIRTPVFLHWQELGAMVGKGAIVYPGPGYEAIICFTRCKQSKQEVGLGTRLQE